MYCIACSAAVSCLLSLLHVLIQKPRSLKRTQRVKKVYLSVSSIEVPRELLGKHQHDEKVSTGQTATVELLAESIRMLTLCDYVIFLTDILKLNLSFWWIQSWTLFDIRYGTSLWKPCA